MLTKVITTDILRNIIGLHFINDLLILPSATGMSLTLSLLSLSKQKPGAKFVIWPRIDQKTCLKSITAANLTPVTIEPITDGDSITTNLDSIKEQIAKLGAENVLAVFSTTSCFAPRVPDKVVEIAEICKEKGIFHIVNNAYGLQCTKITSMLVAADQKGRLDLVIQSTDKNFMVPVGGSIVFSSNEAVIAALSSMYPGRASMSPVMDLFCTFLSMGRVKLVELLKTRKDNFTYFKEKLTEVLKSKGERVLETPLNKISMAFTIGKITACDKFKNDPTFLGSFLFRRRVMGARVVSKNTQKVEGIQFSNYGSHTENYPDLPYITVAAAIGSTRQEIDEFLDILKKL